MLDSITDRVEEFALVRLAAERTSDLNAPRPVIYWCDFWASAVFGYAALILAIVARLLTLKLLAGVASILALYRAVSFIHELTHLKPGSLLGFRGAWNLVIGVPLLVPSFMYEGVHNLHHARTRYGTDQDPEYLPLAHMRPWSLAVFLLVSFLAPLGLILRYAVLAPLSAAIPPLRKTVVEQFSALSISPSFRRKPPEGRVRRDWLLWETLTSVWAVALVVLAAADWWHAVVIFACVAAGVAVLNQMRTLVAHLWESHGEPVSITQQYLDSVNVPGGMLAEFWAPVGLRYHALHHLLPGLPYHALGTAHRRLSRDLPPESDFHRANHASLTGLMLRLLRASWRAG